MRLGRSRSRTSGVVSDDAILDAAVAVLSRDPEAPLERIAARADIEAREIRERYRSRQALVDATVMRGARRIAHAAVIEDGSPAEQIALLVARIWEDQAPVAPFTTIWMRSHLRADVEQVLDPVRVLLATAIARGAGPGGLRADLPESTVAWLVEHAVLTCLAGVADGALAPDTGRHLAITHALTAAGLSWDHAGDVATAVETRIDTA